MAPTAKPIFHYYFYQQPEEEDLYQLKDTESRNYYDVMQDNIPNFEENICTNWGVYDFQRITEDVLWKQMPRCEENSEGNFGSNGENCCVINAEKGYLNTPGFPFYYGRNMNLCYRFQKSDGCGFKIFVLDFAVEPSYQCQKDAFVMYGRRYCGYSLMRSQCM